MKRTSWLVALLVVVALTGCTNRSERQSSSAPLPQAPPAETPDLDSTPTASPDTEPAEPSVDPDLPPMSSVEQTFGRRYDMTAEVEVFDIARSKTVLKKQYPCFSAKDQLKPTLAVSSDLKKIAFSAPTGVFVLGIDGALISAFNPGIEGLEVCNFSKDGKLLVLTGGSQRTRGSELVSISSSTRILRLSDNSCRESDQSLGAVPPLGLECGINNDRKGTVRDLWTGETLVTSTTYYGGDDDNDVKGYAVSADGSTMAVAYDYSTAPGPVWVQVWDINRRRLKLSFTPGKEVTSSYLSLDWNGEHILFNKDVWDISDGARYLGRVVDNEKATPGDPTTLETKDGKKRSISPGIWWRASVSDTTPSGLHLYCPPSSWEQPPSELWDLKSRQRLKKWPPKIGFGGGLFTSDCKKAVVYNFP